MPDGWWLGGMVPACRMESISAALLLLLALASCVAAAASIRRREALLGACWPGKQGMTGAEAGGVGVALGLAVLHLAHALGAAAARLAPVHLALHAGGFTAWAAVAAVSARAARSHAVPRFLLLALAALALYGWALASYSALYLAPGAQPMPFPPAYLRAQLWTELLQALLAAVLLRLELRKPRGSGALPAGYTPLADEEAPAAEEGHTWVALFFEACRFVWPQTLALQLRLVLCLLLLVLMRVLNLAVPILFKHLIDRLGEAYADAKAGRPDVLLGVLSPWTLLYLAAVFFQGGARRGLLLLALLRLLLLLLLLLLAMLLLPVLHCSGTTPPSTAQQLSARCRCRWRRRRDWPHQQPALVAVGARGPGQLPPHQRAPAGPPAAPGPGLPPAPQDGRGDPRSGPRHCSHAERAVHGALLHSASAV
jgi:hypothetical protein